MGGAKVHYDGIVVFSQTDFTEDLKKITVPVLVMHGDDDQIVQYADSAPLSAKLLKKGVSKTYKGFPHGMPTTEAKTIKADLLAFIKGRRRAGSAPTGVRTRRRGPTLAEVKAHSQRPRARLVAVHMGWRMEHGIGTNPHRGGQPLEAAKGMMRWRASAMKRR